MARLVEVSDDEFPDLTVVVRKHGKGANSKATGSNNKTLNSSTRLQNSSAHPSIKDHQLSQTGSERPKSRRRVLNNISDNPPLRTFSSQKEGKQSPSPSMNPKFIRQAFPVRPKRYEQYTTGGDSNTSSVSNEEETPMTDSTGLSDFIVDDSSFIEDGTEEDMQPSPPRSARRLIREKRPLGGDSSEGNPRHTNRSRLQDNTIMPPLASRSTNREKDEKDVLKVSKNGNQQKGAASHLRDQWSSVEFVEPLGQISFPPSESESPGMVSRKGLFITPPTSPQRTQKKLLSPKKGPRIPSTPHRPSTDAFWDPDVINEWNEEYSPRKAPKGNPRTSDGRFEVCLPTSPTKKSQPTRDRSGHEAKKAFAQKKHEVAEAFLRELDESITGGKVFEMAALTGGVKIIWSKKLNTTAGRANWKRETMRSTTLCADNRSETKITYRHYASIELAEKVIDDEERLLNVIAHEFCHLANFMISGIRNNPHGKEFKSWAIKCSRQFYNRGIHVTTKHSFDIDYKYIWECTNCGTEFKRHSKSINPLKHLCGLCKSKLVQTRPLPRTNITANDYQLFVKENMKMVKDQNPGSPQKQIMTLLGKMYQEHKASKLGGKEGEMIDKGTGDMKISGSREVPPNDNQLDLVMEKLNILDLTSP